MFTILITHQLIDCLQYLVIMDSALLHLAPNSTDAKIFEGFANSTKGSSTTAASGNRFNSSVFFFFGSVYVYVFLPINIGVYSFSNT